jgi:hypothetical protein
MTAPAACHARQTCLPVARAVNISSSGKIAVPQPAATSALRSFVSPERRFTVLVGHLLADLGDLGTHLEPTRLMLRLCAPKTQTRT